MSAFLNQKLGQKPRDIGDIGHPELVWAIDDPAAGEVRKDRAVVVAVG
jgi:hypothetical protein